MTENRKEYLFLKSLLDSPILLSIPELVKRLTECTDQEQLGLLNYADLKLREAKSFTDHYKIRRWQTILILVRLK